MRPPKIKPSTSDNRQDPISQLPNEIFFHLFNFLSSKYILQSSTVNRFWREALLSSPTTFSCLELSDEYHHDPEEVVSEANEIIRKVVGYASLSNNRLRSVYLSLRSFRTDFRIAYRSWETTKISSIFDIFILSSSTLTNLDLDFAPPSRSPIPSNILHVVTVVKNLHSLEALRRVKLSSKLSLELGSGASDSKMLEIASRGTGWRDQENVRPDESYGMTVAVLIGEACKFTGKYVQRLKTFPGVVLSSTAFGKLRESRESLLDLSLHQAHTKEPAGRSISFFAGCPNLRNLELIGDWPPIKRKVTFCFRFPHKIGGPSRLKRLKMSQGEYRIFLNEDFFKFAAGDGFLESLELEGLRPCETQESQAFQCFHSLLKSCTFSLTRLALDGLSLAPGPFSDKVDLPNLQFPNIRGSSQLVQLFLSVSYRSLQEIVLEVKGESEVPKFKQSRFLRVLKSCCSSLERVTFGSFDVKFKEGIKETENKKWRSTCIQASSMSLPKIRYLEFGLDDETLSKYYLPINYFDLTEVYLPHSSRLSKSSFSINEFFDEE